MLTQDPSPDLLPTIVTTFLTRVKVTTWLRNEHFGPHFPLVLLSTTCLRLICTGIFGCLPLKTWTNLTIRVCFFKRDVLTKPLPGNVPASCKRIKRAWRVNTCVNKGMPPRNLVSSELV